MKKDLEIITSLGNKIASTFYQDDEKVSEKLVIFVHGFKGYKDWGFWPYCSKYLNNEGYSVLTFNFSHNGIGEKIDEFTEIEKFAENSYSLEVMELKEIIDSVSDNSLFTEIKKIYLIGHSRGGASTILASVNNPRINGIVTWSGVSKLDRYSERQKEEWHKFGVFEVLNTRTKQLFKMNYSFMVDILENQNGSLSLKNALNNFTLPYLIAHAEQDFTVPISEGKELLSYSNSNLTEFIGIPNSGHTFNVVHPFEGTTTALEFLLKQTKEFLNKIS